MASWLQLARKTCIVTGAGSGIGAAVARTLTAERCRVVLADRNLEALHAFAATLDDQTQLSLKFVECDVTDAGQVADLIHQADAFASHEEGVGDGAKSGAQLLVNCAGITRDDFVGRMDEKDWDDVLDVNLKATFLLCHHFLDQERVERLFPKISTVVPGDSGGGSSIVNIGSIVSELGNIGQANYAASKGGVLGLTRALAKEVAYRNVRVNAVVPGFIDTPMAQAVPDHIKQRITQGIPLRRFGKASEVADLVAFLLSPRSSYITGESIRVSGMIAL